ncbi:putative oxidoreductase protein [Gonapodya prolifera JEL478]|uniref:Putative oxidoreductase protein n=1 Tax=Gonapodya prolifera (strain JEL478) TaxID=1344416 RepID=A0A139AX77_GONPJ|nr:putative oxidoreductase protein [Gonapodya prolifera JEL478]|eukprot:KXS21346.1 putative oxidoreductase protein [Gonapodya prolifera JEL478]
MAIDELARFSQVFRPGALAVILGSASGIGREAAKRFASLGMKVAMGDNEAAELQASADNIRKLYNCGESVFAQPVDVTSPDSIATFHGSVKKAFGDVPVNVLMCNAGTGVGTGALGERAKWDKTLAVNMWGVINGCQEFVPDMIKSGAPGYVVNTGSKQGITCPPGNLSYNVSKAAVKVFTEGLAHELRTAPTNADGKLTAALLVPGWVNTGISFKTARDLKGAEFDPAKHVHSWEEKPAAGAWMPDKLVDYFLERLKKGDFYIICPDNEVTEETDKKRVMWAAGDVAYNRAPLSRWDARYAESFKEYMAKDGYEQS